MVHLDAEMLRGAVGELQCCWRVVGGCDDVAAPIRVDLDRRDGFAELNVQPGLEDTRRPTDFVEPANGKYASGWQESWARREKADRERPL